MKKLLFLFLLLTGIINAQVFDQGNTSGAGSVAVHSTQTTRMGFTAGLNGTLTLVEAEFYVGACNSQLGQLTGTARILDSSATNVLATTSITVPIPYSTAWFPVTFSAPAVISVGEQYYIEFSVDTSQVCDTSNSDGPIIWWYTSMSDSAYAGGDCFVNGAFFAQDAHFKTYVDTSGCLSPINLSAFEVTPADCGLNNGEASVNATGGFGPYTYSWSANGGMAQNTGQVLAPGTYTVYVSDTTSCVANATVLINSASPIVLGMNLGSAITCSNSGAASVSPTMGTAPYTFNWSTGATSQSISGITIPGSYTATVTDNNGCTATDSVHIYDYRLALYLYPFAASCGLNNGSISISYVNDSGPLTYSWSGPNGFTSSLQNLSGLEPGMYFVTAMDTVCTKSDSVLVQSMGSFTINTAVNSNITCYGDHNGSATVTVTGTSTYTATWCTGEVGDNAYYLAPGINYVNVYDSLGCSASDTIIITEPMALMDSLSLTEPACGATNGMISASVSGGTGPYMYFWSTGNTGSSISGVEAGIYMIDITDANGCIASDAAILGSAGGPVVNQDAFSDITCNGADDGMIAVSITGGTAPYTVFWTDMDSTYITLTRTNLQAGPYELVVADASGCQTIFGAYINEPGAIYSDFNYTIPTSCISGDGSIDAMVYGGTMPYSYLWSNAQTGSTNSNLVAGAYVLTITDANGCTSSNDAYLSDNTTLDAYGDGVVTNCGTNTGSIDVTAFDGSGNYSYAWTNGANTEDISSLYPGAYGVTITDNISGCKKVLEFYVESSTASYTPEVCMVTVDSTDEKNIIIWERPAIGGISAFVIYRETSQAGMYRYIGTTPIDSLTQLKDTVANADLHGWKYKISAIDSCGVETGTSEVEHRPVFLTVDTNGVGTPSLVWTDYIGRPITDYIVKRNANNTGWVDVATVPSSQNTFDDVNCPSGYIEYTIEVVFATTCEATRGAINTSRSNIKSPSSLIVGIKETSLSAGQVILYPNPSSADFTVSLSDKVKENANIEVVNALGQIIYNTEIAKGNKAQTISAANWMTGIYFVRINSSEIHTTIKFVKQ